MQQLRLRRGLRQNELAERAGLDSGYLNRLENNTERRAHPKPETINRILDALDATPDERSAVFHVDTEPLTPAEIRAVIAEVQTRDEDNPRPVTLLDYRWTRWYHNRAMRCMLALSDEEYFLTMGEIPIYSMIDPASPTYLRIPEDDRKKAFAHRSQTFRRQFAGQEFDRWYLEIVNKVNEVPWAAEIWNNPPEDDCSPFMDSYDATLLSPILERKLEFTCQFNRLMKDPRFMVVYLTPNNSDTAMMLDYLCSVHGPSFSRPPSIAILQQGE